MPKNIVICIDGTADFAAKNPTHVFRLFRALERSERQVCYYDGGVGTLRDVKALTQVRRKILQVIDLATASTIYRNFCEAYAFLARNYEDGDSVFMFGFSRGAYTVRVLAGAVQKFGILYPEQENLVPYVWQEFRRISGQDDADRDDWAKIARMKGAFGRRANIKYMGVWDTVSAVGLFRLRSFPQTYALKAVTDVRHAVSIDERRNKFPANHIRMTDPGHTECWFAGVHRDVGGGGSSDTLELSMYPFKWIVDGALANNLQLQESKIDRMYDPAPDPCGKDNYSKLMIALYGLGGLVPFRKWDSDRGRMALKWLVLWNDRRIPQNAWVHGSVLERMRCKNLKYRPKNLDEGSVNFGEPPSGD